MRTLSRALVPALTRYLRGKQSGSDSRADRSPQRPASQQRKPQQQPQRRASTERTHQTPETPRGDGSYPGDFRGKPNISYAPDRNGEANPGEIVWTWVPYEEDHSQGKDRPVLIIGRDADWFLGLQLTSKDHDQDAEQEARAGRYWHDIGTGEWDNQGRPSEVRVNRIIRVNPDAVRREGAILDRAIFDEVAAAVRQHAG